MTAGPILERINTILVEAFELDAAEISDDSRLREDLDLDSLDAMDLIALLENEFSIRLDDKRLLTLNTVGDVKSYVTSLCEAGADGTGKSEDQEDPAA